MRYLLGIFFLIVSCSSPTEMESEEEESKQELSPIEITHHMNTFSGDVRIKAFTNDSLIKDTTDSGKWQYTTSVNQGDSLTTTVTFLKYNYGETKFFFTHKSDTVGKRCTAAPGYPEGYTIDCSFTLTEDLYKNITN